MHYDTCVSVVITTRHRPDLLPRALESALKQTHPPKEVIVVIDGTDQETLTFLQTVPDPRLRVIALEQSMGGCSARNTGVSAARCDWVAFLDDDDEWRPEKLQAQLKVAANCHAQYPIVSCRVLAQTPGGPAFVWPKRRPLLCEHLSDYILSRNTMTQGEGLITTSMILAPRELLIRVPFTAGLRRHQEWDWLLRATASAEAEVAIAWDVLATWFIEEKRESISGMNHWRTSFDWITSIRRLVTPRAYASFLLIFVSSIASKEKAYAALRVIVEESRLHGRPTSMDYVLFTAMWLLPQQTRRRIRNFFVPEVRTA
jgi:glycosyltransferase involved in cell wall biosynthesis